MKLEPAIYSSPRNPGKWTAAVRVDGVVKRLGSRFASYDIAATACAEFCKLKRLRAEAHAMPADRLENLLKAIEKSPLMTSTEPAAAS